MMTASSWGRRDVVQALIDKGADVNAKTNKGKTALLLASRKNKVKELLIGAGAKSSKQ